MHSSALRFAGDDNIFDVVRSERIEYRALKVDISFKSNQVVDLTKQATQ